MNTFKQCAVCGLNLPMSMMSPIKAKHNGKLILVGICNRCKERKIAEAKRRTDETTH